jgi:hypothetical protein
MNQPGDKQFGLRRKAIPAVEKHVLQQLKVCEHCFELGWGKIQFFFEPSQHRLFFTFLKQEILI